MLSWVSAHLPAPTGTLSARVDVLDRPEPMRAARLGSRPGTSNRESPAHNRAFTFLPQPLSYAAAPNLPSMTLAGSRLPLMICSNLAAHLSRASHLVGVIGVAIVNSRDT